VFLSSTQAGAISKRLGKLLQSGTISHREFAIGQALLWRCRPSGKAVATISYSALQKLAQVSRKVVAAAVAKLQRLGLLRALKFRVRVPWLGSTASRQAVSSYVLLAPDTEFPAATIYREIEIKAPEREVRESQAALAEVRRRMEARMLLQSPTGSATILK
jgi:hypothetical protein